MSPPDWLRDDNIIFSQPFTMGQVSHSPSLSHFFLFLFFLRYLSLFPFSLGIHAQPPIPFLSFSFLLPFLPSHHTRTTLSISSYLSFLLHTPDAKRERPADRREGKIGEKEKKKNRKRNGFFGHGSLRGKISSFPL